MENDIGNNLKRVRLLKNLSLKEASRLLNISATAVQKYEKGELLLDSTKLIKFADAYGVKCSDFLISYNLPQMQFMSFRKKKRLKGIKLDLLKTTIQEEIAKYLLVLNYNNIDTTLIKLKKYLCSSEQDAEQIANNFRIEHELSMRQPIYDITNTLENLGILIVPIRNINNMFSDFDGLSEIVNGVPVIALLDDIKDGARQRFTIAHELGHLLLDVKNKNLDEEKLCNRFASALLMPKDSVLMEFGSSRKYISLFELKAFKEEYKVSFSAIVYRLKDLKIISNYQNRILNININKFIGKNDNNPIEPEITNQFKKLVYKLQSEDIISIGKARELLGVSANEYEQENNNYRH